MFRKMFYQAKSRILFFIHITRKGEQNEIIREIRNHDRGLDIHYVLAHVFERVSAQSYFL